MKEIQFQSKLIKGIEAHGGYAFKCNNRFKVGIHDLWVGLPELPGFFVECKVMKVPERTIELLSYRHTLSVPKEHRPSPMQIEFERKVSTKSRTRCIGLLLLNDCRIAVMGDRSETRSKFGDLMFQLSPSDDYLTNKKINWELVAHAVGSIMRGWYDE